MSQGEIIRFSQILGQERAKQVITHSILNRRIPHAYLFSGIAGVGKGSMGKAIAASLNCESPEGTQACGTCTSCRQIMGGNFPDFIVVRPDKDSIRIKQIREVQDSLRFAPFKGGHRVIVLDQADTMTEEAANAFLKTLEEPPKRNLFILNAVEPDNLLPTIVSRCQKVPFVPLPGNLVADYLVREIGIQKDVAVVLAKLSEGSLGKAIAMTESDFLEHREKWLRQAMEIPRLDPEQALDVALELSETGAVANKEGSKYEIGGLLDLLGVFAIWYRDLLVVKKEGSEDLIVNADYRDQLKNFARKFKLLQLYESLLVLDQAQRDIRMRRNKALVLERTILRLKELAVQGGA